MEHRLFAAITLWLNGTDIIEMLYIFMDTFIIILIMKPINTSLKLRMLIM